MSILDFRSQIKNTHYQTTYLAATSVAAKFFSTNFGTTPYSSNENCKFTIILHCIHNTYINTSLFSELFHPLFSKCKHLSKGPKYLIYHY